MKKKYFVVTDEENTIIAIIGISKGEDIIPKLTQALDEHFDAAFDSEEGIISLGDLSPGNMMEVRELTVTRTNNEDLSEYTQVITLTPAALY